MKQLAFDLPFSAWKDGLGGQAVEETLRSRFAAVRVRPATVMKSAPSRTRKNGS